MASWQTAHKASRTPDLSLLQTAKPIQELMEEAKVGLRQA
jgi:hypothetical protein